MTDHPEWFGVVVVDVDLCTTLVLSGEFDVAGCASFGELVDAAGEGGGEVVVEASAVDFIDSCGLVALIAAKRRVGAAGGRLRVINPSPRVRRVLDLSGTADVFDVAVTDG